MLSARSSASVCLIVLTVHLLSSPLALADSEQAPAAWFIGADGLRFKSEDEHVDFRIKARLEGEIAIFVSNDTLESQVGELDDDSQIRRARITFQGLVGRQFHFKMETGFADSELAIKTVYAGLRNLPHDLTVRSRNVFKKMRCDYSGGGGVKTTHASDDATRAV